MNLQSQRFGKKIADHGPVSKIVAAGALCWRQREGGIEVLLIHRPNYDDWSWPKGKLDDGETLPQCAVREIREEINLNITLGIPLPITHYEVKGRSKEVWYWAAEIQNGTKAKADGKEVDKVKWVDIPTARKMLTMESDVIPLDYLEKSAKNRTLRTKPFIIVRHAKAKPRSTWTRAEADRPLAPTGRRQAFQVSKLLTSWMPTYLISSPWQRCIETMTPFLRHTDRRIRQKKSLTETAAREKPAKAQSTIKKLMQDTRCTAVCTHRPVLPLVLAALKEQADTSFDVNFIKGLPAEDPYLKPGAIIVGHQAIRRKGKIVAFEVYDAFDD